MRALALRRPISGAQALKHRYQNVIGLEESEAYDPLMSPADEMLTERPSRSYRIVVLFERREDGGLRAWCEQVPGFVLSHRNADAVLSDIQPALEGILSAQLGMQIITTPLSDFRSDLEACGVLDPQPRPIPDRQEYAALVA